MIVSGTRVYLDANVLIALVESSGQLSPAQVAILADFDNGRLAAVTSEITLAECLVRPLIDKDTTRIAAFEALLDGSGTPAMVPVDRKVLRLAADARARDRMRLPDAIHVATAIADACDVFLSADRGIRVPAGLRLIDWRTPGAE
jgi:predicted nucleic acid-binding protein